MRKPIDPIVTRLDPADAAEVEAAIEQIVAALSPEMVYLFGSRSRGEARPDSDVDVFVVVADSDLPAYRLDQKAYQAIGPHRVPLDIVVSTRAEFDRRSRAPSSLPATVLREGALVYAA